MIFIIQGQQTYALSMANILHTLHTHRDNHTFLSKMESHKFVLVIFPFCLAICDNCFLLIHFSRVFSASELLILGPDNSLGKKKSGLLYFKVLNRLTFAH